MTRLNGFFFIIILAMGCNGPLHGKINEGAINKPAPAPTLQVRNTDMPGLATECKSASDCEPAVTTFCSEDETQVLESTAGALCTQGVCEYRDNGVFVESIEDCPNGCYEGTCRHVKPECYADADCDQTLTSTQTCADGVLITTDEQNLCVDNKCTPTVTEKESTCEFGCYFGSCRTTPRECDVDTDCATPSGEYCDYASQESTFPDSLTMYSSTATCVEGTCVVEYTNTEALCPLGCSEVEGCLVTDCRLNPHIGEGVNFKASAKAVYFCASDGKRYTYTNEMTFLTWNENMDEIKTVTDQEMGQIDLRGNVVVRPGTHLVKITTIPKVFQVEPCGLLRHVPDESTAQSLYGNTWSTLVRDLSDAFWPNYMDSKLPLTAGNYSELQLVFDPETNTYFLVREDGTWSPITEAGLKANRFQTKFAVTKPAYMGFMPNAEVIDSDIGLWDPSQQACGPQPVEPTTPPTNACVSDGDCAYFDAPSTCDGDRIGFHKGICVGGQCKDSFTTTKLCPYGCNTDINACIDAYRVCNVDADCQQWQDHGKLCINDDFYTYDVLCRGQKNGFPGSCEVQKKLVTDCEFSCNVPLANGCINYTGTGLPFPKPLTFHRTEEMWDGAGGFLTFDITAHYEDVRIETLMVKVETADSTWASYITQDSLHLFEGSLQADWNGILVPQYPAGPLLDNIPAEICWETLNKDMQPNTTGEPVVYIKFHSEGCNTQIILTKGITLTEMLIGLYYFSEHPEAKQPDDLKVSLVAEGLTARGMESNQLMTGDDTDGLPIIIEKMYEPYLL